MPPTTGRSRSRWRRMLPDVARLRRKLEGASDPAVLELVPSRRRGDDSSVLSGFGALASDSLDPGSSRATSRTPSTQADRRHDQRRAVEARLQMAARRLPAPARRSAACTRGSRRRSRSTSGRSTGSRPCWCGTRRRCCSAAPPPRATRCRTRAWRPRPRTRTPCGGACSACGCSSPTTSATPSSRALWAALERRVLRAPSTSWSPSSPRSGCGCSPSGRSSTAPTTMSSHLALAGGQSTPLLQHLARLAGSELAAGIGDHRHAADLLRSVVDEGSEHGLHAARAGGRRPPRRARGRARPGRRAHAPSRPSTTSSARWSAARARSTGAGCRAPRCAPATATSRGRPPPARRRARSPPGTACRCSPPGARPAAHRLPAQRRASSRSRRGDDDAPGARAG